MIRDKHWKIWRTSCRLLMGAAAVAGLSGQVFAQLYTEDFDDGDAANRWTVNTTGLGLDLGTGNQIPMDTNFDPDADGVPDDFSGFAFDYSTVGIPSAPNSSGGSTLGMKLQANLFSDAFGGFSVSPNSASVTGDFSMKFDYWGNAQESPAGQGSTNLSYFGFGTTGTFANYPGTSDGVWFGATTDGDSGSDYRVYDYDQRQFSYQLPGAGSYDPAIDDHATHPTDLLGNPTRDGDSSPLLQANFGNVVPPAAMQAAFPTASLTDPSFAGSMGWEWHEVEIRKEGDLARWIVDGIEIISLDMSALPEAPGENILFGHSDINQGSSLDFNAEFLLFTLIDNIEVTELTASAENADFNGDGLVAGDDFVTWQRNFEITDGSALAADGDANGDGNVTAADLALWQSQFGTNPEGTATAAAVPEPTAWALAVLVTGMMFLITRPQKRLAPAGI